jgi:hypothetical protein
MNFLADTNILLDVFLNQTARLPCYRAYQSSQFVLG